MIMRQWYKSYALILSIIFTCSIVDASESILILRSKGQIFEETAQSLSDEIAESFSVREMIVDDSLDQDSLRRIITEISPKMIVLMNNTAINILKQYYKSLPDSIQPIPSLSLMAVYIKKSIQGLDNAMGISYEIPVVTAVTNLRSVLNKPITKIGVVYREFMVDFIKTNREYCKAENIELIEKVAWKEDKDYRSFLKTKLKELLKKDNVEALWIINDNAFLKPDIIRDIWIPLLDKYKIPAIVGVEALVHPNINLGTFAVLPDHSALGIQAAEMIYIASENNWEIVERVVPPLSVYKIVNMNLLLEHFKDENFVLENIDKILQ